MAEIFGDYARPKMTSTLLHTLEHITKMILKSESLYVIALYVSGAALQVLSQATPGQTPAPTEVMSTTMRTGLFSLYTQKITPSMADQVPGFFQGIV